jgi:hypothetical protein
MAEIDLFKGVDFWVGNVQVRVNFARSWIRTHNLRTNIEGDQLTSMVKAPAGK